MGTRAPTIHVVSSMILHGGVKHMKNKLDRFDDDWKWDVLPTRMLYELLLSPTYRWPWKVKIVCSYRWGAEFPKCPRCGTTMKREYQLFCNHCGQRLNWSGFDDVEVRYILNFLLVIFAFFIRMAICCHHPPPFRLPISSNRLLRLQSTTTIPFRFIEN